jgi:hypothetical protein
MAGAINAWFVWPGKTDTLEILSTCGTLMLLRNVKCEIDAQAVLYCRVNKTNGFKCLSQSQNNKVKFTCIVGNPDIYKWSVGGVNPNLDRLCGRDDLLFPCHMTGVGLESPTIWRSWLPI